MVGCAAEHCNNSSTKGFIMKIFPRDPKLRIDWIKNVGRKNWTPTDNSRLCEVHFTPEMWERRLDNKPKLKFNAVPTIFGHFIKTKTFIKETKNIISHTRDNGKQENEADKAESSNEIDILSQSNLSERSYININKENNYLENNNSVLNVENENLRKFLAKQNNQIINLRKKLKCSQFKTRILQQKLSNDKYKKALFEVFTKDQIKALLTKRTPRQWPSETIQRALKLKLTCGSGGYKEVQELIPLPHLRTIRRVLKNIDFKPDHSDCMYQFLAYKKKHLRETDLECGIVIDEMGITPRKNLYDGSIKSLAGNITFPNEDGLATHAFVFMLVDIGSRWKHIVRHEYTGNSFNSKTLRRLVRFRINEQMLIQKFV